MSGVVSIGIPCEAFDVLLSADREGPTDLEQAVLLFLAARGHARLEDVLAFLSLSEKLAMDLITDLWRAGYLLVDVRRGSVHLEQHWLDRVKSGTWSEMRAGQRLGETAGLMRDMVSGQVVENIASRASPSPESAGPILVASSLDEGFTPARLAQIAWHALPYGSPLRGQLRERMRSLRAEVTRRPNEGLSWLMMEFEAREDPHVPGSLTLRAAPTDDVVRSRLGPGLAQALTAWALDNPDHPVVAALRKQAKREGLGHGAGLGGRIDALARQITGATAAPKAHKADARRWRADLVALAAEVQALEAATGQVTLRLGEAAAPAGFLGLATDFEHQLVLAAPTLDYDGLLALSGTAVERLKALPLDASAVVLWGGRGQRDLPENAKSFLDRTRGETALAGSARFLSSHRASRIAAALAVVDGRRLLYASASPLLVSEPGEAGARGPAAFDYLLDITAPPPSPIPRRALEIARERAPDTEIADQIELKPWEAVAAPQAPIQLEAESPLLTESLAEEETPDIDPGDDAGDDPAAVAPRERATSDLVDEELAAEAHEALSLKAVLHDMLQLCQSLAARTAEAGSTVDILTDGALYQQALDVTADEAAVSEEATLWLGFGRDETSPYGVPLHRALTDAIEDRAKRGLATVVLVDPPPDARGKGARGSAGVDITGVRELARQFPPLVAIHETPGLTGHILCGETRFLAAPGGLASPPVVLAGRLAHRLVGVAVSDPGLCADFRRALAERWPALKSHLVAPRLRPRKKAAAPLAVTALVEAWRRAPLAAKRAGLLEAIKAHGGDGVGLVASAQALLALTEGAQEGSIHDLRRDILALAAAHGDEALARQARAEMVADAWRGRRWQEAAVILAAAEPAADLGPVSAELALAAAAVDVGLLAPELSAVLAREDADGWMAGVALAARATLFNGDEDLADFLQIKLTDPPPEGAEPLAAVAHALHGYWGQTMRPLDPASVRAMVHKDGQEAELRALALAFAEPFRVIAGREYNNAMLSRVVPRVYSDVSGFKPVADLIGAGGAAPWPAVLKGLKAALGEGPVNVQRLANEFFETSRQQFGRADDEPVFGGRGKGAGIHSALHDIIRAAVALRDGVGRAQATQSPAADAALAALLTALRECLPPLTVLAAAPPPASAAAPLLADLGERLAAMIGDGP